MSLPTSNRRASFRVRFSTLLSFSTIALLLTPVAIGQQSIPNANYKLAQKYSTEFLSKFVYDSAVQPQWIGESELFWYRFRTSSGTRYWLIDPVAKTKAALFDHDLLAAKLSEASEESMDADRLDLRNVKFDASGDAMSFEAKDWMFVFHRAKADLEKKEKVKKAPPPESRPPEENRTRSSNGQRGKSKELEEKAKEAARKQQNKQLLDGWRKRLDERGKKDEKAAEENIDPRRRGSPDRSSPFSPDLGLYAFAKRGNLYVVERTGDLPPIEAPKAPEAPEAPEAAKSGPKANAAIDAKVVATTDTAEATVSTGDKAKEAGKAGEADGKITSEKAAKKELSFPFDAAKGLQLSTDAEKDYLYGGTLEDDDSAPVSVHWAPDSQAFYVTRRDSRGVAELYLVNSLAEPRPELMQYQYPMPGEENVRHANLMVFDRGVNKLVRIKPKWQDESYVDVRWLKNGELRVLRRDRPLRNVEYGIVDPKTGEFAVLFAESIQNATLFTQSIRYLEDRGEFLWWSERSGWAHYYLYGLDGKLKNAVTRGTFRASRIVEVDEKMGVLWFTGNARERDESLYHDHLYRVRLDGGGLKLLDAGDATHNSTLSKSRNFLVDNSSQVDLAPASLLRDGEGTVLMELERADMSRIEELGWRPPERFTVKAADGITELCGNMWKPFDFDAGKKYPLIVHVYPGPQTEGLTHTFSATSSFQELAQIGFIVIQVGHRGGAPTRSKAYATYGYFNMRDYGLEDKKTAIEQLAARHDFIDIDRIGIYGHSGGGFMTAAALLKEPFNKFFKVGVSTSGNHDNNIYNSSWAEQYHGLKEVEAKAKAETKKAEADANAAGERQQTGEQGDKKGTENKDAGKKDTKDTKAVQGDAKKGEEQEQGTEQQQNTQDSSEKKTRFDIKVATNAELAANLEGKLLLIHGEMDNNVHPAGTMRLVNALIKANKRFDMLIIPGASHSYGSASTYAKHRTWDYFAEHLLGDRHTGADIRDKSGYQR